MSSDLLTNTSAMTALLALNQTQQSLNTYENQVSTGLAICGAKDNAAYWSIATTMNTQVGALGHCFQLALRKRLHAGDDDCGFAADDLDHGQHQERSHRPPRVLSPRAIRPISPRPRTISLQQQQSLLSIGSSSNVNGVNFLDGNVRLDRSIALVLQYPERRQLHHRRYRQARLCSTRPPPAATTGILGQAGAAYSAASILTLDVTQAGVTSGDIGNMLTDV